jgi:hypothetical protein
MEEEKAANAGAAPHAHPGCLFCTIVPLIEQRLSEAGHGHFRAARVEFLKGVRSLIDDRIAYLSRDEAKGTHVVVE